MKHWCKVVDLDLTGRRPRQILSCGATRETDLIEYVTAEMTIGHKVPCMRCGKVLDGGSTEGRAPQDGSGRLATLSVKSDLSADISTTVGIESRPPSTLTPADAQVAAGALDADWQESRRLRVMAREVVVRDPRLV